LAVHWQGVGCWEGRGRQKFAMSHLARPPPAPPPGGPWPAAPGAALQAPTSRRAAPDGSLPPPPPSPPRRRAPAGGDAALRGRPHRVVLGAVAHVPAGPGLHSRRPGAARGAGGGPAVQRAVCGGHRTGQRAYPRLLCAREGRAGRAARRRGSCRRAAGARQPAGRAAAQQLPDHRARGVRGLALGAAGGGDAAERGGGCGVRGSWAAAAALAHSHGGPGALVRHVRHRPVGAPGRGGAWRVGQLPGSCHRAGNSGQQPSQPARCEARPPLPPRASAAPASCLAAARPPRPRGPTRVPLQQPLVCIRPSGLDIARQRLDACRQMCIACSCHQRRKHRHCQPRCPSPVPPPPAHLQAMLA